MENYCAKCGTKTENLNPNIFKTKNSRIIMQSIVLNGELTS